MDRFITLVAACIYIGMIAWVANSIYILYTNPNGVYKFTGYDKKRRHIYLYDLGKGFAFTELAEAAIAFIFLTALLFGTGRIRAGSAAEEQKATAWIMMEFKND